MTHAYVPIINSLSSPGTTKPPLASCTVDFTRRGRSGLGTWLGKGNDPRYTPTTTFEGFPFPEGLSPDVPAADYAGNPRAVAIAKSAQQLVKLRDRWLNPCEWVEWTDEPVPGYPQRPVPRDAAASAQLKRRTLTSLHNLRPHWLTDAHAALDAAVAAAYGWDANISVDDALLEMLKLSMRTKEYSN